MDARLILTRPIKEYMTKDLRVAHPNDSLEKVNSIFNSESIHHLPVVDKKNRLMGIISKSDLLLLKDWGTKYDLPSSTKKNLQMLKSNLAEDLMEKQVFCLYEDDTVEKCLDIFRENYFRSVPVVDGNMILKGIITPYDLLIAAFRHEHLIEPQRWSF